MNDKPIVFFDSGVGGLPYLKLARARLGREQFIYVADRLHYPLGDKTQAEIRSAVGESFQVIMNRIDPKAAVIACNTASVAALQGLRDRFPIPFVGVVPAVKPAAALTRTGRIGVLATPQTVKNDYLTGLIDDFASDCAVLRIAAPELRDLVEQSLFTATREERARVLAGTVAAVREADVDVVVLACTHFLHVDHDLELELGDRIRIIDSREGVVNQLLRVIETHNLFARKKTGRDVFYVTGDAPVEARYSAFAAAFGLELGGTLT